MADEKPSILRRIRSLRLPWRQSRKGGLDALTSDTVLRSDGVIISRSELNHGDRFTGPDGVTRTRLITRSGAPSYITTVRDVVAGTMEPSEDKFHYSIERNVKGRAEPRSEMSVRRGLSIATPAQSTDSNVFVPGDGGQDAATAAILRAATVGTRLPHLESGATEQPEPADPAKPSGPYDGEPEVTEDWNADPATETFEDWNTFPRAAEPPGSLQLEDGSGNLQLEDGSGNLQLEGGGDARVTEDGRTRVTSDGDIRITAETAQRRSNSWGTSWGGNADSGTSGLRGPSRQHILQAFRGDEAVIIAWTDRALDNVAVMDATLKGAGINDPATVADLRALIDDQATALANIRQLVEDGATDEAIAEYDRALDRWTGAVEKYLLNPATISVIRGLIAVGAVGWLGPAFAFSPSAWIATAVIAGATVDQLKALTGFGKKTK